MQLSLTQPLQQHWGRLSPWQQLQCRSVPHQPRSHHRQQQTRRYTQQQQQMLSLRRVQPLLVVRRLQQQLQLVMTSN